MCVYSMIVDHYKDKWTGPYIQPYQPVTPPFDQFPPAQPKIPTQEEINEFYELLRRAKEYDKKNNQPDCDIEDKKKALQELAKVLGIEISFP